MSASIPNTTSLSPGESPVAFTARQLGWDEDGRAPEDMLYLATKTFQNVLLKAGTQLSNNAEITIPGLNGPTTISSNSLPGLFQIQSYIAMVDAESQATRQSAQAYLDNQNQTLSSLGGP
jgi:hypothetical protein